MSTEGDSAKSALSDANDKSGTDNHTDTSQDSVDVPVLKEKPEKQTENPVENDVENKNAVEKKDEEKPDIEEEKESAPESEELDSSHKDEEDSKPPNKEKATVNDNKDDDVKKEDEDKKEKEDDDKDKNEEKKEKKAEVKEPQEKEESKQEASDKDEEEGEEEDEPEGQDEEEVEEEDEEEEEEVVKKKPVRGGRKEKKKAVPLLDQPLETTGKRERKNVQRFTEPVDAKEPTKVEAEAGSGTPLGEIPRVDASISRFKNDDLKLLHKLLFKQVGKNAVIKKQIKKFNGFPFAKDSEEYKKKVAAASKFEVKHLKSICEMLDLTKTGTKDDIVGRIFEFLLEPKDSGKPVAGGRPKRASAVRANNRGYSSHDDYSSDEKHSSRARRDKGKRTNLKDESSSDEEFRPDNVSDGSDEKPKVLNKRKRGKQKKKKAASSEEEEGSLSEPSSDESDEEPKSKRRRSVKVNNKSRAKATPRGRRGRPKATPAPTPRRGGRRYKEPGNTSDEEDEGEDEEGSSSEDEPLAKKKSKNSEPPTDDEIKTFIKSILEGANLEEITMKTVCQRVYANYPEFDLSHKKDFIKTTVKSLIST